MLSANVEAVYTKLACTSLVLILYDTRWMQAVENWFDPSEKLMREFLISSELVFLMSKCLGTGNVCGSKKSSASLLRIG